MNLHPFQQHNGIFYSENISYLSYIIIVVD